MHTDIAVPFTNHEAKDDALSEEILHLILWKGSAIYNLLFVILQFFYWEHSHNGAMA